MYNSINRLTCSFSLKRVSMYSRHSRCTTYFSTVCSTTIPHIYKPRKTFVVLGLYETTTSRFSTVSEKVDFPSFPLNVDTSSELSTIIQNVEPSLSSLGLGGWYPKGLVQSGLELLHYNLEVPWWSAIVIGTICLRIVIFPLVVIAQKNAANLNNNMPTLQKLQQRMTQARMCGDIKEAAEISERMMEFMKVNKVNPLKNMLVPLVQVPIFLSVFTGVREMANLPIESWKLGGILWFTDLTIPDPIYLLPLMTAVTLYATIEAGVDGIKANQVGSSTIKFVLRSMPFVAFPFMINFPSAMLCYWFTSNTFSLLQVLILKIPRVKLFFNIPSLIDHSTAHPMKEVILPKQTFSEGFKQSIKNIEIASQIAERKRMSALKIKEAKESLSPKTFSEKRK